MNYMKYEIGSRIKKYRKSLGLSQKELAQIIDVSTSRISNWEQGTSRPDVDMLAAICKALRVSANELLDINFSVELSSHEQRVIQSYRQHSNYQAAINRILGLSD